MGWRQGPLGGNYKSFIQAEVVAIMEEPSVDFLDGSDLLIEAEVIVPLLSFIQLFLPLLLQVGIYLLQLLDLSPHNGDLCLGVLKLVVKPRNHLINCIELILLTLELALILGLGTCNPHVVQFRATCQKKDYE